MPQTPREIRDLLARQNHRPRHRFGQNFMVDGNLVRAVADAGEVVAGDTVVEVGPGTGTLTGELIERVGVAGKVVAFEIDRDLAALLRREIDAPNFELVEGDALAGKRALHPRLNELAGGGGGGGGGKLVANLPYNVASPLVIEMLVVGCPLLAFTVQLEVAERMKAGPGTKQYGPLSVMAQVMAEVEVLRTLPPGAFWPPPKITSGLVRLRRRADVPADPAHLSRVVTTLFQRRRKTLRNAAEPLGLSPADLEAAGVDPTVRPETLDVPAMLRLAAAVASAS